MYDLTFFVFFLNDLVLCLFVCFVLIHTEMTLIAGLLITETMEGVFHCLLSSAIWGNWRELWLSHPDPLESPNQHKCQYVTSSGKGRNNSEIFCYTYREQIGTQETEVADFWLIFSHWPRKGALRCFSWEMLAQIRLVPTQLRKLWCFLLRKRCRGKWEAGLLNFLVVIVFWFQMPWLANLHTLSSGVHYSFLPSLPSFLPLTMQKI